MIWRFVASSWTPTWRFNLEASSSSPTWRKVSWRRPGGSAMETWWRSWWRSQRRSRSRTTTLSEPALSSLLRGSLQLPPRAPRAMRPRQTDLQLVHFIRGEFAYGKSFQDDVTAIRFVGVRSLIFTYLCNASYILTWVCVTKIGGKIDIFLPYEIKKSKGVPALNGLALIGNKLGVFTLFYRRYSYSIHYFVRGSFSVVCELSNKVFISMLFNIHNKCHAKTQLI